MNTKIITTHGITLHGTAGEYKIVLRPLCDAHLPLLYKWNADPDVIYWTEWDAEPGTRYGPGIVDKIYGDTSRFALNFLIEVDGTPVGDCWLQKIYAKNPGLPYWFDLKGMYPDTLDVRQIDMLIGEKAYWNKGIGTEFVRMLAEYAFTDANVDILHCFNADYNIRARKVWEKNGFKLVLTEELTGSPKGNRQHHFRLTRSEYLAGRK